MQKSLLKPLTVAELKTTGGSKITKIGVKKRKEVSRLLASAHSSGRSSVESVTSRLKKLHGKKRNWERVAVTELTDAKGKASLAVIQQVFGSGATVYRLPGASCCEKCKSLFGSTKRPRMWTADKIPPNLVGAVHPNCVCGPWRAADMPDLTKSVDPRADVPMGLVRREMDPATQHWTALISTGNGYWTRMDSPTGRAVVQTIAMHIPVIKLRESKGFTVFVHGTIRTKNPQIELYDLRRLSGARFYPMDIGHDADQTTRVHGMTKVRDLNQYLTHLKTVMPSVATMPEYWDSDRSIRWLTDFFGYKTLTDWVVMVPGSVKVANKIRTVSLSVLGQRKALRSVTYDQLEGSELKKCY